jgi:hypothetical protein
MSVSRLIVLRAGIAVVAGLLATPNAHAVDYNFSGFGSIVAGYSSGSCTPDNTMSDKFNTSCTRFVADWAHAGVYSDSLDYRQESKLGVQGTLKFSPSISLTSQLVARTADVSQISLEWAYLTFDIDQAWTVQVGRKRLPLFYYSDSQDVGFSYPWLRLPPDVYGWDAVNYNGASATYRKVFGQWSMKVDAFTGSESTKNSPYGKLYYMEPKTIEWNSIVGGDVELNKNWLTLRLTYIHSGYQQIDQATNTKDVWPSGAYSGNQTIYGASLNVDTEHVVVRSEYSVFDRGSFQYTAKAWMMGVGSPIGKWTPMLTASGYRETTRFPDNYVASNWGDLSLSVRYDVTPSSALKFQVDRLHDGPNTFMGDSNMIAVSYDFVF